MELGTTDKGEILLTKVYSGVLLETDDKETIGICMRDTGFEFNYNGVWYEAKQGIVREMKKEETKQETLEEVIGRQFKLNSSTEIKDEKYVYLIDKHRFKIAVNNILKWQQERMYSEEKVELILNFVDENYYKHGDGWIPNYKDDWITTKELLEIFKNK